MGTLDNQSFKPANQDSMTTMDMSKMRPTAPPSGVSVRPGQPAETGNTIGAGGASGDMRAAQGPAAQPPTRTPMRTGMGGGRIPTEGDTNSLPRRG